MENKILHGDSLELLKDLDENSIDSIVTDPPYGYSFMGKDWDKAVPSIKMWKECLRVLKPGGFAFIMSAPRADVQGEMIKRLEKAGFRVDFTPVYWTYATGFPKASNISKMIDKRLGKERKVTGTRLSAFGDTNQSDTKDGRNLWGKESTEVVELKDTPASDKAKELDGSYGGYQPKPAVEVILVVMKPLSEKSYIDQAMKDGKGVTWLDDVRIPLANDSDVSGWSKSGADGSEGYNGTDTFKIRPISAEEIQKRCTSKGRFPANLLVQDDVLNDGTVSKSVRRSPKNNKDNPDQMLYTPDKAIYSDKNTHNDEGSFSRYYDLDKWWEKRIQELPLSAQKTYPFFIIPKAGKKEKNKGCEELEPRVQKTTGKGIDNTVRRCSEHNEPIPSGYRTYKCGCEIEYQSVDVDKPKKNFHPTVKPISLMSYLVTLSSREGELVLDPFVGSGTTCIAANLLNRKYIGMEMDDEYVVIAQERIKAYEPEQKQHEFF